MAVKWEEVLEDLSPRTSQFKVLTYLAFRGTSQPSEISEQTGIPAGTVRPALRTLLEKGYVSQVEGGAYRTDVAFTDIISHLYSPNK
jgi:DNA-binding IclR family transcriptional regulator